jgi:hypothetical protein
LSAGGALSRIAEEVIARCGRWRSGGGWGSGGNAGENLGIGGAVRLLVFLGGGAVLGFDKAVIGLRGVRG